MFEDNFSLRLNFVVELQISEKLLCNAKICNTSGLDLLELKQNKPSNFFQFSY